MIRLRRGHVAALAALAIAGGFAVQHTVTTKAASLNQVCQTATGANCPVPTSPACGPAVPMDGTQVCTHDARVGVTPEMVTNAQSFAGCLGTQGVTPPAVVHDPYSITFVYAPGVVPSAGALAYCHANAVRIPVFIKPITPPN